MNEIDWTREAVAAAGSLLLFAGSFLLGSKQRRGWWFMFLGNATWTGYGVYDQAWVIVIETLIFQGIAIRGWLRWRKE